MAVLVKEIMSKPVYTIDQNKSAAAAGKLLRKIRRGFLVVTLKHKPVGVLSDSDLIKRVVAANKKPSQIKIRDIMTTRFVTIDSNADVMEAVRKMRKGKVHRLPVVENSKVMGIISLTDVAKTSPEMLEVLSMRAEMKEEPLETQEEHTSGMCDNCDNFSVDLKSVGGRWLCETCREESEEEK